MDSLFRLFLVLILAFGLSAGPAAAQVAQSPAPPANAKAPQPAPQVSMPATEDGEVTILRDEFAGKYNPSTLENLSKLYWRLGAFDLDDDMAVGNFLKINDCKIFTEYLNDDLEWKEIVKVMKAHLAQHKDGYPLDFQFLLELNLGRYDPDLGGFPIVNRTAFVDAKRIEVDSIDQNREVCYDYGAIKDYPKSLIIILPEPFTLDFIKVDEHVAQAYILRKKAEFSQLPEEVRVRRYERDAYLRLRVTFSQYHGNLRGEDSQIMSILYGKIDGYEIFEDSGQKRLMLSVDNLKKKPDTEKMGQMSVPTQPLPPTAAPPAPAIAVAEQPQPQQESVTTVSTVVSEPVAQPATAEAAPAQPVGSMPATSASFTSSP